MNENLYEFYIKQINSKARNNPIYQYSLLVLYTQGILWSIEKYKNTKLYCDLEKELIKETEKRIYVGIGGRKNIITDFVKPYLRNVDYLASIPPLLFYFPEITPKINQENLFISND